MRTLLSHKEPHSRFSWKVTDLLRRTCVQEAKSSRSSLCGLVIFFFFSFLSFFLSILLTRGWYGDEGIQPKTSAKNGCRERGLRAIECQRGNGRQVKSPKKFITFELRPYTTKPTASRPICAVKQLMAESVLWWGTTWEYSVL